MHLNGIGLFRKYARPYFKGNIRVLEIAPFGGFPSYYNSIIGDDSIEWWGVDVSETFIGEHKGKDRFILSDKEYEYPFEDNFFDIVLSDQVIAHVKLFWIWMNELKRIVKENGHIITIGALSYPSCPSPVDCWRIYPDGMIALNDYLGLKTIMSKTESLELEYFGYNETCKKMINFKVASDSIATTNTMNPELLPVNKIKIRINKFMSHIPIVRRYMPAVRIAYDTVTIAQKSK